MSSHAHIILFNSPLETGIRALAILVAAYPQSLDIERLVEMDYLVVHSEDASGPTSLHVALPMRSGELLIRRGLIEKGLELMMSKNLIQRIAAEDGFNYIAGEVAAPFLASLTSSYSKKLKERANWAIEKFSDLTTSEIRQITHKLFENWTSQFQAIDRLGGN